MRASQSLELPDANKSLEGADGSTQPNNRSPAVIAELTRWAAQNLELTLKSKSTSDPGYPKKQTEAESRKCNTTRGEPKACAKEEANQSNGDREERLGWMEPIRSANRASEAGKRTAAQRLDSCRRTFERELPLMQRQGPATLEGPPTTRITVANPPFTLLNG
ncbi:hypothetical protein OSB04_un000926 [Centaurea solstitialis]|uniref:Uncharacterized protein n=1 Tax=Centaurea solstitialis TaxID=347529 RepID=A0AA38W259_9ASTR|nr:hypothetical protein OSB04_un000926 [Centaurea solstitialis]